MSGQVKKGHTVQLIYNCEVLEVGSRFLKVRDKERGLDFNIQGNSLIESLNSADNFDKTEKVTKTEIARLLTETHGKVFSIKFTKQGGEERMLKGYLTRVEPLLGRCYCVDLYAEGDHKLRLVDNRTISELIVDGTKYTVK